MSLTWVATSVSDAAVGTADGVHAWSFAMLIPVCFVTSGDIGSTLDCGLLGARVASSMVKSITVGLGADASPLDSIVRSMRFS